MLFLHVCHFPLSCVLLGLAFWQLWPSQAGPYAQACLRMIGSGRTAQKQGGATARPPGWTRDEQVNEWSALD